MFYEPKDGHGLPKNPFNSLVIPRPIGWISTVDKADDLHVVGPTGFGVRLLAEVAARAGV